METLTYTEQLEATIEELQIRLAVSESKNSKCVPVVWRQEPLNPNRQNLYIGSTRIEIAVLMHTHTDIHKKGCFWQLSFKTGENTFHFSQEEAYEYTLRKLNA